MSTVKFNTLFAPTVKTLCPTIKKEVHNFLLERESRLPMGAPIETLWQTPRQIALSLGHTTPAVETALVDLALNGQVSVSQDGSKARAK